MNLATDKDKRTYERGVFTGAASEYLGIWFVNILLTILTLGIYSAWAREGAAQFYYGTRAH